MSSHWVHSTNMAAHAILKALACFIRDESGQGTVEYAGMLALAAMLAFFAYRNGGGLMMTAIKLANMGAGANLVDIQ
jgi:Flp pilus assembly pilin Flp